jgi:hypothetical protein
VPTAVITDLRFPTIFTYVDTYSASNCDTATLVYTVSYTAYLQSTNYPAPSEIVTIGAASVAYVTYTFPGLTVSTLRPRDEISMVRRL